MSWNWLTITALIIVVLVILLVFIRARIKKSRGIQGNLEHPGGYKKYHRDTKIYLRRALLSPDKKEKKKDLAVTRAVAVLNFKGDIKATGRQSLSRMIDEIILNKEKLAEVVIKVESPGGSVTDYGHAYGEILRLREAQFKVTACVDTVAATGGYLMCIPASKIIAAPFSMVGSIGVVSFVPNIRRLLEKLLIEARTFTAGDYKRTVSLTDDATPEQVERFNQQLQLIHDQFKQALFRFRPQVDLSQVATGEAWLASTTVDKDLKLVDEIRLSSDYLLSLNQSVDLVEFYEKASRRGLKELLGIFGVKLMSKVLSLSSDSKI